MTTEIRSAFMRAGDVVDGHRDLMDTHVVADMLSRLQAEVLGLLPGSSGAQEDTPAMSRVDALKLAREHVEAMSTNARGYQDGVKLSDKVQAMDAFARFLMGESA